MNNDKLHIKEPGFKTPKNYFDSLEYQIVNKIVLESSVSNKSSFVVPQNYFEQLEARVLTHPSLKHPQPKIISILKNKTVRYAASIAAVLLVFFSIFKFQQTSNSQSNTITQIENYIDNGYLDISYIDYEALLTDEMLEDTSFFSTLDQQELFEYLSYEIDELHLTND